MYAYIMVDGKKVVFNYALYNNDVKKPDNGYLDIRIGDDEICLHNMTPDAVWQMIGGLSEVRANIQMPAGAAVVPVKRTIVKTGPEATTEEVYTMEIAKGNIRCHSCNSIIFKGENHWIKSDGTVCLECFEEYARSLGLLAKAE